MLPSKLNSGSRTRKLVIGGAAAALLGSALAVGTGMSQAAEQGNAAEPMETLRRSAEITRGHRWQLFGLAIVLALINFVGLLACGVGLLFTSGITIIAWAYTYRRLSGQPIEYAAWGI